MKERIIVEEQDIISNDICGLKIERVVFPEGCKKIENVPETFTELKELCKKLKVCKIEKDYIEVFGCLVGSNILFCDDGDGLLLCRKSKLCPYVADNQKLNRGKGR